MVDEIEVSVVYVAIDGTVFNVSLSLPADARVRDAVVKSDFLTHFPNMSLDTLVIGIYSLRKTLNDRLHDKDRIEIYRPLLIDPKDRRRKAVDEKRDPAKWRRER